MKSTSFLIIYGMEKIKSAIIAVAIIMIVGLFGYAVGRNHIPDATKMIQVDTLVKHDTIRVQSPVEIRRVETIDTLIVPITDTLRVRDTVYVVLNRQIKEYRDSLYYARVSGYDPSLDFIEVYPKTVVLSKSELVTQKPSNWRYGVDLGVDYGWMWQNYITPNVAAEIGYKKVTLGVEIGLNIGMSEGQFQVPMPYLQASIKYRLVGR